MVLHNPNNWHWVSKDASGWAKNYLKEKLVDISVEEGDVSAKITDVTDMTGDVDVSQRKGKVITLFDLKLTLEYTGKTKDNEDVSGSITIPEVAHDTEEDEYVFNVDIFSDSSSKQPVKDLIRKSLTPKLRIALATLTPALVAEHGKDLQHPVGSNPSSGFHTPTYYSQGQQQPSSAANSSTHTFNTGKGPLVNTTTLNLTAEFRTDAASIYETFTNPQRLAAFTRAPPKTFTGATPGGKFALFDGNVEGSFVSLNPPTQLTQTWRLRQWPEGHFSKMEISFDQNDADHVTVMRVKWEGVPVGQEEVAERNWEEYYVRSIKTTFGYGTVL